MRQRRKKEGRREVAEALEKSGRGPKTPEGKAKVRLNPLKHGVLSQTPVIPLVEREEDWERLREGVLASFGVEGMVEEALAETIATCIWRRARVVRVETEAISSYLHEVPTDYWSWWVSLGKRRREPTEEDVREMDKMLSARLLPGDELMDKMLRYETKIHRFMLQTISQLLVLQAIRKSGRAEADAPGRGSARPAMTEHDGNFAAGPPERVRGPRPRALRLPEPGEVAGR